MKDFDPTAADDRESFFPDFCAIRMVFAAVVGAELLAMMLALASSQGLGAFWSELSLRSLYVQWVVLFSLVLLCLSKGWLRQQSHGVAGTLAWIMIMLASVLVSLAAYHALPASLLGVDSLASLIVKSAAISGIIAAIVLRYLFEHFQQQQRRLAESRLRFQALQARIRPHFLFNSMNTIASLTRIDPELAETLIQDLSALFRASLGKEGNLSTLADEIDLGRRYLEIEQQRLGGRLRVQWLLDDVPGGVTIPMLTLQPLLENAVYHGVEPSVDGGDILVSVRDAEGRVQIEIRNSLDSRSGNVHSGGANMALENVGQRLAAVFGDQAGLRAETVPGGFVVELWLPGRGNENPGG